MSVMRLLVAIALAGASCAGCASVATSTGSSSDGSAVASGSSSDGSAVASLSTTPTTGSAVGPSSSTLTVRVAMFGGPMNTDGHMAMSNSPVAQTVVTATGADGSKRTATTAGNGVATLHLPPGSYQVAASCSNPHPVLMTPGSSVSVQLDCDVP